LEKTDGLELIEHLRHFQPDSTYLLISGLFDVNLAKEAVNEHAVSYVVPKPWSMDELSTIVRRSTESYWERKGMRDMQRNLHSNMARIQEQKARLEQALADSEMQVAEALL